MVWSCESNFGKKGDNLVLGEKFRDKVVYGGGGTSRAPSLQKTNKLTKTIKISYHSTLESSQKGTTPKGTLMEKAAMIHQESVEAF